MENRKSSEWEEEADDQPSEVMICENEDVFYPDKECNNYEQLKEKMVETLAWSVKTGAEARKGNQTYITEKSPENAAFEELYEAIQIAVEKAVEKANRSVKYEINQDLYANKSVPTKKGPTLSCPSRSKTKLALTITTAPFGHTGHTAKYL